MARSRCSAARRCDSMACDCRTDSSSRRCRSASAPARASAAPCRSMARAPGRSADHAGCIGSAALASKTPAAAITLFQGRKGDTIGHTPLQLGWPHKGYRAAHWQFPACCTCVQCGTEKTGLLVRFREGPSYRHPRSRANCDDSSPARLTRPRSASISHVLKPEANAPDASARWSLTVEIGLLLRIAFSIACNSRPIRFSIARARD